MEQEGKPFFPRELVSYLQSLKLGPIPDCTFQTLLAYNNTLRHLSWDRNLKYCYKKMSLKEINFFKVVGLKQY